MNIYYIIFYCYYTNTRITIKYYIYIYIYIYMCVYVLCPTEYIYTYNFGFINVLETQRDVLYQQCMYFDPVLFMGVEINSNVDAAVQL